MTVPVARGIFNRLAGSKPDVIVAELGDGILGEYGVQDILHDAELMRVGAAYIMAAPDPVACWGAAELMRNEFALPITALTGPATDNEVGLLYIQTGLGLPAHNARRDAPGLLSVVQKALENWAENAFSALSALFFRASRKCWSRTDAAKASTSRFRAAARAASRMRGETGMST